MNKETIIRRLKEILFVVTVFGFLFLMAVAITQYLYFHDIQEAIYSLLSALVLLEVAKWSEVND